MKFFFVKDSEIMSSISDAILEACANGSCTCEKEAEEIALSYFEHVRWIHFFSEPPWVQDGYRNPEYALQDGSVTVYPSADIFYLGKGFPYYPF